MYLVALLLILIISRQYGKLIASSGYVYILLASSLFAWPLILKRWRRGIFLLLIYLPFAGFIGITMPNSKLPLLFKDILFIIPLYIAFILTRRKRIESKLRIPSGLVGAIITLAIIVFAQMFNPQLQSFLVGAMGAKAWLSYIPLMLLAFYMIDLNP